VQVLAHQGGWDELLWFAAPIVGVILWVRWAERKARHRVTPPLADDEPTGASSTLPGHADDH
jgi:hypothetical protein